MSKISDEEIVEAIVVVVSHATGLSPSGSGQTRLLGDVPESTVTIVVKQITGGIAIPNSRVKAGSVHQKNIEPAIVVVVEERHPATHLLEQKLFVCRAAGNVSSVPQSSLASNVGENDGRRRVGSQQMRRCQSKWQCCPGPAQQLQKPTPRLPAAGVAIHAVLRAAVGSPEDWRRCAAFSLDHSTPYRVA